MASKLHLLQSKAVEASKLLSKQGCGYYKQLLEQNKQYIQEPPTVEKCRLLADQLFYTRLARLHPAHPLPVARFLKMSCGNYHSSRVEVDSSGSFTLRMYYFQCIHLTDVLLPPVHLTLLLADSIPGRYEAFWKELDYVKQLFKNRKEMKIEDAGIAALFGIECFAWFCAGEIVGRGCTITGYHV
ncbi:mitochondrial ATP synthase subunit G protein [Actinidia rufa]|uniref:Mitochondrial ATP synthase subunit G protein n=1 Tax=Actinidia rufa TaxID=165716 RepID=A0A7J0GCK9_9ERIC|nr:mitochondrial ATP synthase subunit G protein [Actinidia rufa]